jgi:hypothetical protein
MVPLRADARAGFEGRQSRGSLIEGFMPTSEVAERHEIRVDAPIPC